MKLRFVHKRFMKRDNSKIVNVRPEANVAHKEQKQSATKLENKKAPKKKSDMNEMEKIAKAEDVMAAMTPEVKVVKKERGLIERTESSKIILTEDNRQVLND